MQINKVTQFLILFILLAVAISSRFVNINAQGILIDETWVVPNTNFHFEEKSIFPKLFNYEKFHQLSQPRQDLIRKIYDLHPLFQIAALHATSDLHPPLFFFLNYYWSSWFGYDAGTIRTPAAIYFILTLFLLFNILKKQNVSLWGTVMVLSLVILSPIYLFYSNNARPYTLLMLLSLLSSYLSYRLILNDFQKSTIVYYLMAAAACLYTHYYGVLMVASQVLYMLIESLFFYNRKNILKVSGIGVGLVAAFLPAALIIILRTKLSTPSVGPLLFDHIGLANLLDLVLSFGLGYSRSTLHSYTNIVISVIQFLLFILGSVYLYGRRNEVSSRFWLSFLLLPFAIIVVFNAWKAVFTVRNCLILLIPYLTICGIGLYSLKKVWLKASVSVLVGSVGLFFIFYGLNYGNVKGPGALEDWRSTGSFIKGLDNSLPVFVYQSSYRDALYYYIPDIERIKGFPEDRAIPGPEDKRFVLVVVKFENPTYSIETKVEKELPFLKKADAFNVTLLGQFTYIYVYEVERRQAS